MTLYNRTVEDILSSELDEAKQRYSAATAYFDRIMGDTPSGLPHPDGSLRIRQAGVEQTLALEAYHLALRRFHEFILSGIIPVSLREAADQTPMCNCSSRATF